MTLEFKSKGNIRMKTLLSLATAACLLALPTNSTAQKPPDFPLQCHGAEGMASTSGKNLIIDFKSSDQAADDSLPAGYCSWRDRGMDLREPTRIVDERPSKGEARRTAELINTGKTWTFWVFNVGRFFRATTSAMGTPKSKPVRYDE